MYVEISNGAAAVREAVDLRSLSVRVLAGVAAGDLAAALAGLGEPADSGEHAWLYIDALKAASADTVPAAERAEWANGFDGMIAYATSKGWTSADAQSVRAHLERRS